MASSRRAEILLGLAVAVVNVAAVASMAALLALAAAVSEASMVDVAYVPVGTLGISTPSMGITDGANTAGRITSKLMPVLAGSPVSTRCSNVSVLARSSAGRSHSSSGICPASRFSSAASSASAPTTALPLMADTTKLVAVHLDLSSSRAGSSASEEVVETT